MLWGFDENDTGTYVSSETPRGHWDQKKRPGVDVFVKGTPRWTITSRTYPNIVIWYHLRWRFNCPTPPPLSCTWSYGSRATPLWHTWCYGFQAVSAIVIQKEVCLQRQFFLTSSFHYPNSPCSCIIIHSTDCRKGCHNIPLSWQGIPRVQFPSSLLASYYNPPSAYLPAL